MGAVMLGFLSRVMDPYLSRKLSSLGRCLSKSSTSDELLDLRDIDRDIERDIMDPSCLNTLRSGMTAA